METTTELAIGITLLIVCLMILIAGVKIVYILIKGLFVTTHKAQDGKPNNSRKSPGVPGPSAAAPRGPLPKVTNSEKKRLLHD